MIDVTTDEHFANPVVAFTDKKGNPAKVDGLPVWASSDETVLHPVLNADGTLSSVETVGPSPLDGNGVPIPARITVTADADLGTGVQTITGVSEDVIVTLGIQPASVVTFTFGPATPKV